MHREQAAVSSSRTYSETRTYRRQGARATNVPTSVNSSGSLCNLHGGDPGLSMGRGGSPLRAYNYFENSNDVDDNDDDEDDDDDNVCPSMLFSCFPCLNCFSLLMWITPIRSCSNGRPSTVCSPPPRRRPRKRPRSLQGKLSARGSDIGGSADSQTNLMTPLLSEESVLSEDFPKDVQLVEVEVESARHIPPGVAADGLAGATGVYVGLRMTPVQEGIGEQTQQTSVARWLINPRWGNREKFTFFVTARRNSRVLIFVQLLRRPLHQRFSSTRTDARTSPDAGEEATPRNSTGGDGGAHAGDDEGAFLASGARPDDPVLGEGYVDLAALFPVHERTYTSGRQRGNSRKVSVPMHDPIGRRRTRCVVVLELRYRRVSETMDSQEDRLYEYQRWTPLTAWASLGNQEPRKWSTVDGSVSSDEFNEVAPPPRHPSQVLLPWCPLGGWEYSRREIQERSLGAEDELRKGSSIEKYTVWAEGFAPGYEPVRRRLWRRISVENTPKLSSPEAEKSIS